MATKMAGVTGGIPGMKKFSKYGRWAGLSTAASKFTIRTKFERNQWGRL